MPSTANVTCRMPSAFAGAPGASPQTRRRVELGQLEPGVVVWRAHHRDVRPDSVEPNDAIHPAALDRCLAFQLESEFSEERHRGREVVNDYAHVVHPLDRHVLDDSARLSPSALPRGRPAGSMGRT
jgi:hypothetical protein